jgi:hypothetical protein
MNLLSPNYSVLKESRMGTYSRWNGGSFHLRTFILEFSDKESVFTLHEWLLE